MLSLVHNFPTIIGCVIMALNLQGEKDEKRKMNEGQKCVLEKVRPHGSYNSDIKSFIAKDKTSSSQADLQFEN